MPKNKKPAGGRPAKNFDPRYAKKSAHRGQGGPAAGGRKNRWTDEDRAARSRARDISRGSRDGRRDDRFGAERLGDDRRAVDRDRRFDRGDAPGRDAQGRNDRSERGTRVDRDGRRFDRGDGRGARSFDGRGRQERFSGGPREDRLSDNRAAARIGREDRRRDAERADRGFDGRRSGGGFGRDHGGRGHDRNDRDGRSHDRNDRGGRGNRSLDGGRRDDRGGRPFADGARHERLDGDRRDGSGRGFARGDRRSSGPRFDDRRSGGFDRAERERDADRADRRFGDRRNADRTEAVRFGDDRRVGSRHAGGARRLARDDRRPSDSRFDDRRAAREARAPRRENAGERAWREHRDTQQRPHRTAKQEERIDVVHEKLEAQAIEATDAEGMTFAGLGFGDNIVRALAALGAEAPFPIQVSTAAPILDGRDVLARGRTGSGKTIAFGAPLVERILRAQKGTRREFGRAPVALILAPTRELALQIDRTVQPIARSVGLFTTQIYGGVPQGRQVGALKKGVDIVIGTPGRIEDLHKQGKLDLSQIRTSILDEADHMCELGFLEPVQRILRLTSEGGQKLLFSATLDREVASLVDEFLENPAVYEVAGETQETGTIDHRVLVVEHRRKPEILEQLVDRDGRTLVFTRTRAYAEMLAEQFDDAGIRAIALHGDLNQAKRTRNIEKFSKGRAQVLVATDVAARGIHVDDVDLVVQADAPDEYKTYLHRAGRTGRAGNEGRVVTLIPRSRRRRMEELLHRAEIDAPFDDAAPGDDLIAELAGAPTIEELTD